jgi:formamidopyrimidine-DNA glycosylase
MPELPEVETVTRALRPLVLGRRIRDIRRIDAPAGPKYAGLERAAGATIDAVLRRGKFMLLQLSSGDVAVIHLGMTGTLSPDAPIDHERVCLRFADGTPAAIHFRDPRRFGRFIVAAGGDFSALPTLAALGPEPFDPAFTVGHLAQGLANRHASIKSLLLGQRIVAGLGNIYADEALWVAGIHPEAPADAVPRKRLAVLHGAIIDILARAIDARGTTLRDYRDVDGDTGSFGNALAVYGRAGAPCPRCETLLLATIVAQRTSTFCPRCQKPPSAGGRSRRCTGS